MTSNPISTSTLFEVELWKLFPLEYIDQINIIIKVLIYEGYDIMYIIVLGSYNYMTLYRKKKKYSFHIWHYIPKG